MLNIQLKKSESSRAVVYLFVLGRLIFSAVNFVNLLGVYADASTTIPVGNGPNGIVFDPLNGYFYMNDYEAEIVSVIDGNSDTLFRYIQAGKEPNELALKTINSKLCVTNFRESTVTVISTDSITQVPATTSSTILMSRSTYTSSNKTSVTYSRTSQIIPTSMSVSSQSSMSNRFSRMIFVYVAVIVLISVLAAIFVATWRGVI